MFLYLRKFKVLTFEYLNNTITLSVCPARLSLEVMTLNPICENVETAQGVPLTVTGVAQVKIMKNPELLHTASEQFLGKKEHEIKSTVLQTLEGHLRAILGTLTVEEVYKDRDQFASLVREVAAPDVGRMGIEVLSFTIKVLIQRLVRIIFQDQHHYPTPASY